MSTIQYSTKRDTEDLLAWEPVLCGGRGSAVLSRFAHNLLSLDVVTGVGGSISVDGFEPAPFPPQPLPDTICCIRQPVSVPPLLGGTDRGPDETRNGKQRGVIENDSSGMQISHGEGGRHDQVELEAEPQLHHLACSVGDRNIDRLRMSFPPLRSCYLILSSCSSCPWRNWTRITRVRPRAAQTVAAFRVDHGD